ncbi:MAG: Lpg1974 family pore-forming outer membrane protein [Gammaproteobacteria bacterium]
MKQLAVALAAIGLTTSIGVYAALPTGAQATEVNAPQEADDYFFGASGLLWQPTVSGNDLDYAVSQSGSNTNQQIHNIKLGYDWGFDFFAGYNFGNGANVIFEYLRLHTKEDSANTAPAGGNIIPAHYFATNSSLLFQNSQSSNSNLNNFDTYQRGYGRVNLDFDQADLTVGQNLNIGCSDQLRLFTGLRYSQIEREINTNYSQNPNSAGNTNLGSGVTVSAVNNVAGVPIVASHGALQGTEDDSNFKGIGPLVGLNNTYYLGYGIGFVSEFEMGLLIGDVYDDLTLTNYQAGVTTITSSTTGLVTSSTANGAENITTTVVNTDDARRVVPVVDAKLGFDYTFPFQDYGSFTLEAGWSVSHYWHAVDGINSGASDANLINSTDGSTLVNGITNIVPTFHTNSVGYQGPYVTLTYHGISFI